MLTLVLENMHLVAVQLTTTFENFVTSQWIWCVLFSQQMYSKPTKNHFVIVVMFYQTVSRLFYLSFMWIPIHVFLCRWEANIAFNGYEGTTWYGRSSAAGYSAGNDEGTHPENPTVTCRYSPASTNIWPSSVAGTKIVVITAGKTRTGMPTVWTFMTQ